MARTKPDAGQPDHPTCGQCAFWFVPKGEETGECYLNPPTPALDEDGDFIMMRPLCGAKERGCGYFTGRN